MTDQPEFTPIILGNDRNAYGMARAFHERYGLPVPVLTATLGAVIRFSKIIELHVYANFDTDSGFIAGLSQYRQQLPANAGKLLLVPGSEQFTMLVNRNRLALSNDFICLPDNAEVVQKLQNSYDFSELMTAHNLPTPPVVEITKKDYCQPDFTLKQSFPLILRLDKQAASPKAERHFYLDNSIDFQKKVDQLYTMGYTGSLFLQDYIQGPTTAKRVLNAYVDRQGHVKLLCLGRPLLTKTISKLNSDYAAMMPDYNQNLYEIAHKFLEEINYVGLVSFDLKYDVNLERFQFLGMHPCQSMNNYFVTLNGNNLAELLVRDWIIDDLDAQPPVYANHNGSQQKLWLDAPIHRIKSQIGDHILKAAALELFRQERWGATLLYSADLNWRRKTVLLYDQLHQAREIAQLNHKIQATIYPQAQ